MLSTCLLAGLLFLTPCSSAGPFAETARSAPMPHRSLVASVALVPGNVGWSYPDGRVLLPASGPTWTVLHEIGHLVGWTSPRGQQLLALWRLSFSPADAPTEYGRTSIYEDFAESYVGTVTGSLWDTDARRAAWMEREVLRGATAER